MLFPKYSQHIEPNVDREGNSISSGQGLGMCTVAKYLYESHFISDIYFAVGLQDWRKKERERQASSRFWGSQRKGSTRILVSVILGPAMAAADTGLLLVPTKQPSVKGTVGVSARIKPKFILQEGAIAFKDMWWFGFGFFCWEGTIFAASDFFPVLILQTRRWRAGGFAREAPLWAAGENEGHCQGVALNMLLLWGFTVVLLYLCCGSPLCLTAEGSIWLCICFIPWLYMILISLIIWA